MPHQRRSPEGPERIERHGLSISYAVEKVAAKAKKPQLDPGKTVVVKRQAARPVIDVEGDR